MQARGILKNYSNELYHSDPAISRSGIMMFAESQYKYWANYINPNRPPKQTSKAMQFGSMFHTFVLEPTLFWHEYIREPELEKSPEKVLLKNVGRPAFEAYKAAKAKVDFINAKRLEDFEDVAQNKIIITDEELYTLQEMYESLKRHPEAWDLIQGAVYEQSYFWQDKESGLMVKSRPDILHQNIIVDLKTCADASSQAFQRSMITGGYHVQGAMVQDAVEELEGRKIDTVINVCIEKTYPYEIGIKIIHEDALKAGREFYKKTCLDLQHAIVHNEWKSYEPETINLPAWHKE